ncbi:hypothetical protein BJY59DRAFT_695351 [Rhodotorula toruloides]
MSRRVRRTSRACGVVGAGRLALLFLLSPSLQAHRTNDPRSALPPTHSECPHSSPPFSRALSPAPNRHQALTSVLLSFRFLSPSPRSLASPFAAPPLLQPLLLLHQFDAQTTDCGR